MAVRLETARNAVLHWLTTERLAVALPRLGAFYASCFYLAFLLRSSGDIPDAMRDSLWISIPLVVAIKFATCFALKEWNLSLNHTTVRDIHKLFLSAAMSGTAITIAGFALPQPIPKSVILLDGILFIAIALLLRVVLFNRRISEGDSSRHKPGRAERWLSGLSVVLILCLSLCVYYFRLSFAPEGHLIGWINADTLLSAHLIDDVVIEGNSLGGWKLPPAPFFVPDLVFASICRLLTDNPAMVTFLAGALLFLLIGLSAVYSGAISTRHPRASVLLFTLAGAGVAIVSATRNLRYSPLQFLYWPNFHTGTYGLVLLIGAMATKISLAERPRKSLMAFMLVLCFLSGFSDLLTISFFTAPFTAALVLGWILNFLPLRRALVVSAMIWTATLAGVVLCSAYVNRVENPNTAFSIDAASPALRTMISGLLTGLYHLRPIVVFAFLWIAGCTLWVLCAIFHATRHPNAAKSTPASAKVRILLLAYLGLAGPMTAAALVAGGCLCLLSDSLGGFELALHYLHPLVYTPLFFWPLLIPDSILARIEETFPKQVFWEFRLAALAVTGLILSAIGIGPRPISNFVPAYVKKIDEITRERGITQGIAYHWSARQINVYTSRDLKVYSVDTAFRLWECFINVDWVKGPFPTEKDVPHPEFVIISPHECYTKEAVLTHFGPPAEEISLGPESGNRSILIYNRKTDVAVHDVFRAESQIH